MVESNPRRPLRRRWRFAVCRDRLGHSYELGMLMISEVVQRGRDDPNGARMRPRGIGIGVGLCHDGRGTKSALAAICIASNLRASSWEKGHGTMTACRIGGGSGLTLRRNPFAIADVTSASLKSPRPKTILPLGPSTTSRPRFQISVSDSVSILAIESSSSAGFGRNARHFTSARFQSM